MTSGWRLMYVIGGAKRTQGKVIRLQRFKLRLRAVSIWVYQFVLLLQEKRCVSAAAGRDTQIVIYPHVHSKRG